MKIAVCTFDAYCKEYSFLTMFDDLVTGEDVLVDTSSGVKLAKVVRIENEPKAIATRWAFQRVNIEEIERLREVTTEMKQRWARRKEIIVKLEKKRTKKDKMDEYREIAKVDEEAKALLDDLEAIDDGMMAL
jgi:hypothetical protein